MITGRKKISLKKPLHLIFPFSIMAIISANTTMMGTSTMQKYTKPMHTSTTTIRHRRMGRNWCIRISAAIKVRV